MANNESKTYKNNTLEQWRQDTNEVSHHLGDVAELDARLTDKVYTYTGDNSTHHYNVYDSDNSSKNLRFEISPDATLDAIATIIMTANPTIPASFVTGTTVFQGSTGSETFIGSILYINKNKIGLQNTTGTFNASADLKYSTDTIPHAKLVRLISESYKVGYVTATVASSIVTQTLVQTGFHVPNIGLRVLLTGSPAIPATFTEGATVTQSGGFSGTLYKATTTELLFKTFTGAFNIAQNAGIPHTDAANRILAAKIASISVPDSSLGNAIEFHTIPASSAAVAITSTNAIDAIIEIQDDIGEITSLGTTDKSDVVSSINEIETAARGTNSDYALSTSAQNFRDAIREHETDIGNMTFTGLSGTDISAALRELRVELGNHASLGTTVTSNAVGAINELETAVRGSAGNYTIGTNANDLVAAINEIETVLRAGNSDYTLTTTAQNVRDAINEHEADIGNMTFTGLSATDISAALRELRAELGDHSTINNLAGYSATTAATGIVELQGDIGNIDNMTTTATKVVLAINELDLKQGASTLTTTANTLSGAILELEADLFNAEGGTKRTLASLGTDDKTSIVDSINELETAVRGSTGNYTLGTSSGDLVGAINELHGEINSNDTDIAARLIKISGSSQELETDLTFGGNKTYTLESGATLDLSAAGSTLLLPGSASGVNTFGVSYLNIDGNQTSTGMGIQIDRAHIGSSPTPYPRVQWREGNVSSKPHRSWQIVGLNDAGNSSQEQDIVTFYNAKDLFANNTETGLTVDWQTSTQNFDVTLDNSVFTLTGAVTGTVTQTAKGNVTIATTATSDPTLTLTGDVSGSATFTNLGNASLSVTVANDSHNHDHSDANFTVGGNLQVNGNTVLGNQTSDTTTISGGLTVTGDLTVNGTNTILNTTTLEVEDTLVLVGSDAGNTNEPTTGGFGLETRLFSGLANAVINGRTWSSTGKHPNAASDISGSHSLVYNFTSDRWEADGSLILSEATLASPGLEVNGVDVGTLTGSKTLDLKAGTGIGLASVVNGNDFEITINNTLAGYSGWFLSTQGVNKGNIADDERVDFFGGTALNAVHTTTNTNRVTFNHDNYGTAGTYGPSTEDGGYIRRIAVNAQGHVTSVTADNFNDIYVREDETSTANTANFVVRRDGNIIRATTFAGNLSGNVTGNVTGNVSGSSGSTTGNAASSSTLYVTSNDSDGTFREVPWITGSGGGNTQFYADAGLTYRSSDNRLRATTFEGALAGNASTSSQVYVTGTSTSTSYRMIFGENNDGYNGYETLYKDTGANFYYNPSTNTLTTGTFSGALNGNASSATIASTVPVTDSNSAANYRAVWHSGNSLYSTAGITFHAGNNTISATRFYGAVTGAITGNVTGNVSGSSGSCTGNAATITSQANSATITASDAAGNSTIVRRTSAGYIFANYLNTTANDVTSGVTKVMVETGNDNYIRHGDAGSVRTFLNVANGANAYSFPYTITSANTANTVVHRTTSGNFSAGTITATLSGNATTATNIRVVQRTTENVNYHILGVAATISGTSKMVNGHGSFYWNGNAARLYAPNITAGIASCTGYAYGNLTGRPTIPTNNNQLTNGAGYTTFAGNTYSNNMNQYVRTSDTVQFGLIRSTGDIVAYYASDERLKDNIQVIDGALEKVSKLRGVEFDWNDKQDVYEGHDIGVIAQDVEAVAPELVQTRDNGYKAVKYEKLTALLIEAVKELKEENKQIRDELEKLRSINS